MNAFEYDKTADSDIIDYECMHSIPGNHDLNGDEEPALAYVPVLYKLPEHRAGNREYTSIESYLRNVLCVEVLKYVYVLEASGKTRHIAKDTVSNKLTTLGIDKALQYGRAACVDIYNVQSGDDLRNHMKKKYTALSGFKNRKELETSVINAFDEIIFFLDLAYSRARKMHTALYHAGKLDGLPGGDEAFHEAVAPHKSNRLPVIFEAVAISIWSGLNADMLWQNFFFYRYVLDAAATIFLMMSGVGHEFSAREAYILYRMCENNISPEKGHGIAKTLIQKYIGGIIGVDNFMRLVENALAPFDLLTHRPATVAELVARCKLIEDPVFSYPAIPLGQSTPSS